MITDKTEDHGQYLIEKKERKTVVVRLEVGTAFLYHWRYDDKSEGAFVFDTSRRKVLLARLFESAGQRKIFQQSYRNKVKKTRQAFESSKETISCGIQNCANMQQKMKYALTEQTEHLFKLLDACGKEAAAQGEVVKLFSGILAAGLVRFVANNKLMELPTFTDRGPIICVQERDKVFDTLCSVVQSLWIDFSQKKEENPLHSRVVPVLSEGTSKRQIVDSAAVYFSNRSRYSYPSQSALKKKKSYCTQLPAQYRDMGVLINQKFYSPKEVFAFQRRNPWTTIVLLGGSNQRLVADPIRLNAKILSCCNFDWNSAAVLEMMKSFTIWLASYLERRGIKGLLRDKLQRAEQLIATYNQRRKVEKIRGHIKYWTKLQLLALELLSNFGSIRGYWEETEGASSLAHWSNLLLPGCCPLPSDPRPLVEREVIVPERDAVELFEETMTRLLTERARESLLVVKPGEPSPIQTEDGGEVLGYLRFTRDNKRHRELAVLQIRREVFLKLAPQFSPVHCDWYEILKALKRKPPKYLHRLDNAYLPLKKGDNRRYMTITLKLKALLFLPADQREHLWKELQTSK